MNAPLTRMPVTKQPAIDNVLQFSLLDESLRCDRTRMPVQHVLAAMRKYYRLRNLSHVERYGTPDAASSEALQELERAEQALLSLGENVRDQNVRIEASLTVSVSSDPV